jgi:hypothetical protein
MMATSAFNVAIALLVSLLHQGVCSDLLGYLLISTPRTGEIHYVKLPANGDLSGVKPQVLIKEGLKHPQGLAIDHKRKRLFVADPDVQKIYAYSITESGDTLSTDGRQTVISDNAESRWVAVDGLGNVFFSDEPKSQIMKITMAKILRGNTSAQAMYTGEELTQVSKPGGVAVDNFHVFWANKRFGTEAGTVVKGSEVIDTSGPLAESISVLASNSAKSYGVCLALNNVFFTDDEKRIFGVKKTGGSVMEVTDVLKKPRGCVWDGDGTVFVADREQNAIFSFPGNMHRITKADVTKVLDIEDAFGLAFLSGATRAWSVLALLLTAAVACRP